MRPKSIQTNLAPGEKRKEGAIPLYCIEEKGGGKGSGALLQIMNIARFFYTFFRVKTFVRVGERARNSNFDT